MKQILITGATGFVGLTLVSQLVANQKSVTCSVREFSSVLGTDVKQVITGDITPDIYWYEALKGVEVVIHLAARVHVMRDASADPLVAFRETNSLSTLSLARQAAASGVKRFIFLSSIKVNGEFTTKGEPFTPEVSKAPSDPYGFSKFEAEQGLLELHADTGMEVVIIRPPLVYGPGVKANFLQMMSWVFKGIPLPLGAILSQRSLVAIDNLTDLISVCIEHPAAAGHVFLVSDDEDVTMTELLQKMANALVRSSRLISIPQGVLAKGLVLVGKEAIAQRLCNSLQVDISKTKQLLGWKPVISVDDAIQKVADDFLKQTR